MFTCGYVTDQALATVCQKDARTRIVSGADSYDRCEDHDAVTVATLAAMRRSVYTLVIAKPEPEPEADLLEGKTVTTVFSAGQTVTVEGRDWFVLQAEEGGLTLGDDKNNPKEIMGIDPRRSEVKRK